MKRIVTIEAVAKRYAKNGTRYPAVPYFDDSVDNYVTGQEKRPSRKGGLTKQQIEGKEPLTPAQRKSFPYPILYKEGKVYPIYKKRKLDLSTDADGMVINEAHHALYNFIIKGLGSKIAPSRDQVDKDKHLFYLNDPHKEASKRVQSKRKILKLQHEVITKLNADSFYELILTLNFNTPETYNFTNSSPDIIEDIVYESCEKYPNFVQHHFTEKGQRELFVLKLLHYEIIHYSNSSFHDKNGKHLGMSISDVLSYLEKKDNQLLATSWSKMLQRKDKLYAEYVKKQDEALKEK